MFKPMAVPYGRFSSAGQAGGASRTRQEDNPKLLAWCDKNGYELAPKVFDEKMSAYTGEHRRKGALGRFQLAIDQGLVAKGTALLVEAVDRLSREEGVDAISFIEGDLIAKAGMVIVTLEDDLRYSRESLAKKPYLHYILLGKMLAAHEYSKSLSGRVLDGKQKARVQKLASGEVVTAMLPAWLMRGPDRRAIGIPERVAVAQLVFDWRDADVSKRKIAERLNEAGVPSWDRAGQGLTLTPGCRHGARGWHASYIGRLCRNRALIGEFTPTKKNVATGKRTVATGEAPTMLYPVIIDPAKFERVSAKRAPAGRRGTTYANVLGGIAVCASCGSPMAYRNKGERWPDAKTRRKAQRTNSYLVCDAAARRLVDDEKNALCGDRALVPYPELERNAVLLATEFARKEFATPNVGEAERATSQALLRTKIAHTKTEIVNTVQIQSRMSTPSETVADMITGFEAQITAHKAEIAALERQDRAAQARRSTGEGRELVALHDAADAETDPAKRYASRARIAGILRRVLSAIRIEAVTGTVTTWAADGTLPEQDDFVLLIAVRGGSEPENDKPGSTNPAWRVGAPITTPADIKALHQAEADGRPFPEFFVPLGR